MFVGWKYLLLQRLDLAGTYLVSSGVDDGAVAAAGTASEGNPDILSFSGAAPDNVVVALPLRSLGHTQTDKVALQPCSVLYHVALDARSGPTVLLQGDGVFRTKNQHPLRGEAPRQPGTFQCVGNGGQNRLASVDVSVNDIDGNIGC